MTPRRRVVAFSLLAALPLVAAATTAGAASTGQGRFLPPFREDHARFANGSFSGGFAKGGPTDGNGCLVTPSRSAGQTGAPAGNPHAYDCLPAGASMVMLPNGKVAFWNALEGEEQIQGTDSALLDGGRVTVNDESRVLDLRSGRPVFVKPGPVDAGAHQTAHPDDLPLGPFSAQHYAYNNGSMFCSDQKLLSNGDVLDAGGTDYYSEPYLPVVNKGLIELEGVKNTRVFHAASQRWTLGPTMHFGRWYPSMITLGNGNLFIASGVQKLIKPGYPTHPLESGTNVKQTETLDLTAARPAWKQNAASADKSLPLFPRFHLLPDGHVYYDAAGQDYNPAGQSYDEALWETASSYDPATQTWTDLGVPGTDPAYLTSHPTALPYAGFRGSTFSAALTMRPSKVVNGTPVYGSMSFLTAGGVLGTSPGSYAAVANSRITTVETSGGQESMKTIGTGDLHQARWYGTATPLPTGQVLVTSGADVDEVLNPGSESPIRSTELFTPNVNAAGQYVGGTWTVVGDQARKRTYHNNAVLQPDGSVLIGGHAPIVSGYFQTRDGVDLPVRPGTNNHHDASFQVWQPPYFGDPGRPYVRRAHTVGRTLVVTTTEAARIASVVLMRNTAQTHLVDADARTVSLPILARGAGTVTVGLPASANVLPNGPYLLFANKTKSGDLSGHNPADLVPSRGLQVFVTGKAAPGRLAPAGSLPLPFIAASGEAGAAPGATASAPAALTVAPAPRGAATASTEVVTERRGRDHPAWALAARQSDDQRQLPVVPALGLVGCALALRSRRRA